MAVAQNGKVLVSIGSLNRYAQLNLAQNPDSGQDILMLLTGIDDHEVSIAVADHPNSGPEILEKLIENKNFQVVEHVAENPNMTEKLFNELLIAKYYGLWSSIARNPSASEKILEYIYRNQRGPIKDRCYIKERICFGLARNPQTPAEILKDLINYESFLDNEKSEKNRESIQAIVALNPAATPEILIELARSSNFKAKMAVGLNSKSDEEVLSALSKSDDQRLLAILIANSNTPISVLKEISEKVKNPIKRTAEILIKCRKK